MDEVDGNVLPRTGHIQDALAEVQRLRWTVLHGTAVKLLIGLDRVELARVVVQSIALECAAGR